MIRGATAYFAAFSELLRGMSITTGDRQRLSLDEGVAEAVDYVQVVRETSKKVMIVGNGGSATIASHIHTDLSHSIGMRSLVYYDAGLLTARANDFGYESAFEWSSSIWADPGDLLLAISSSGQSKNILRTVQSCASRGCNVITFSGFNEDNPLRQMGQLNFYIPSQSYGYVEMAHAILAHCIADHVLAEIGISSARAKLPTR